MLSTGFLIHVSLPQKYTVHWHSLPLLGFFSPLSFLWRKVKVSPVPTDTLLPSRVRGAALSLGLPTGEAK